jgi:hypothetical protein
MSQMSVGKRKQNRSGLDLTFTDEEAEKSNG